MHVWPVQDAKARFSEFLSACLAQGPQLVTRRGEQAAVLVPIGEWLRLQSAAKPTLKALLLAEHAQSEALAPARGASKRRKTQSF